MIWRRCYIGWWTGDSIRYVHFPTYDTYLHDANKQYGWWTTGYITLFASCYPLAAAWSMASNVLEVWSDSFKICFLSKRPVISERAFNIHSTYGLLYLCSLSHICIHSLTECRIDSVGFRYFILWPGSRSWRIASFSDLALSRWRITFHHCS